MERRDFLLALGIAGVSTQHVQGRRRRRRRKRQAGSTPPGSQHPVPLTGEPKMRAGSRVVQPKYYLWKQLKTGMTFDEVEQLLGEPLETRELEGNTIATSLTTAMWFYGVIELNSPQLPTPYRFAIAFNNGKLQSTFTPFKELSPHGVPTKPSWLSPPHGSVFSGTPCFVDLRWEPASGKYPINYNIEVEWGTGVEGLPYSVYFRGTTDIPYVCVEHIGHVGRWRVRGVNALGRGEWSDYAVFSII